METQDDFKFSYQGKDYIYDEDMVKKVTDFITFRDNVGKLIEIGATQMLIKDTHVVLRKNGLDKEIAEKFPELDDDGKKALISHMEEKYKTRCGVKEGDWSKANKGCC